MLRSGVRTVVVTTSYPTGPDDPAGHFVRAEAKVLLEQGHEVHLVAPMGPRGGLVEDPGIHTWPVPHGGAFGWPGAMSRVRARPWRLAGAASFAALASSRIDRLRPERIVAHWLVPSLYPVVASCRYAKDVHAVAHGADVRLLLSLPAPLRAQLMARLLAIACTIRFVAQTSLDALAFALPNELRSALQACSQVEPAPLIMPDVSARAIRIKASVGHRPLAVTVSRLVRSKRVDLAIEATQRLHPNVSLGVVGDGPDASRLRRLAGVDAVRFEGRLPREDALAWIAAADVLVHPSMAEAAPTVVREARLLGTPVVACDAGDLGVWARMDNGIVLAEPNTEALAEAMLCAIPR